MPVFLAIFECVAGNLLSVDVQQHTCQQYCWKYCKVWMPLKKQNHETVLIFLLKQILPKLLFYRIVSAMKPGPWTVVALF